MVSASANVALEKVTGTPPVEVLRGQNNPQGCVSAHYVQVAGLIWEAATPTLRDVHTAGQDFLWRAKRILGCPETAFLAILRFWG